MPETLLSPSNVLLYGRELLDLTLIPPQNLADEKAPPSFEHWDGGSGITAGPSPEDTSKVIPRGHPLGPPDSPPRLGDNNFLQSQLNSDAGNAEKGARLARIYGFSYHGHYHDLAAPVILLVHGAGSDPEAYRPGPNVLRARQARAPADADRTGVAYTADSFSEDMRIWSYDKGDFSIKLTVSSGSLEDLLSQYLLRQDNPFTPVEWAAFISSGAAVLSTVLAFLGHLRERRREKREEYLFRHQVRRMEAKRFGAGPVRNMTRG